MDTSVILAQPRVPRLRAAVVYVDSPGFAGIRRRTLDPGFCSARFARGPPKNRPNRSLVQAQICEKSVKSTPEHVRDLVAQTAPQSLTCLGVAENKEKPNTICCQEFLVLESWIQLFLLPKFSYFCKKQHFSRVFLIFYSKIQLFPSVFVMLLEPNTN